MVGRDLPRKELNELEINILETIVKKDIGAISRRNPQRQLGDSVKGKSHDEILDALMALGSNIYGVLAYDANLNFGFLDKKGYKTNIGKAKEVYDSYPKEE